MATTMAADDDDNEVNGNGAAGNDDGNVSYYNIVKLILLLICLHYNFYRRRLLPPGERTSRGSRWGALASSPPCHPRVAPSRRINDDGQRWHGRPDEDKDNDDDVALYYADGGIRQRSVQCLLS